MSWSSPRNVAPAEDLPPTVLRMQLAMILYAASLPRFADLPIRIIAFLSGIFLWYLVSLKLVALAPRRWLVLLATLAGVLLVWRSFRTLVGYEAGLALLNLMLLLKLLELRRLRDFYVAVVLGLFFLVAQFLINQSMYLALYSLGLVVLLVALLEATNGLTLSFIICVRRAVHYLAQASPFVLVLFLLFPRLNAPLWDLKLQRSYGVTGLGDTMEPGSVSRLIRSREPVMRVEFETGVPPRERLYWRGPVLWHNDGARWTMSDPDRPGPLPQVRGTGKSAYHMILEPQGKRWVPALDMPVAAPSGVSLTRDLQLVSHQPLEQRKRYRVESRTEYRITGLSSRERRRALRTPASLGSAVTDLARRWRAEAADARQVVAKALDYFRRGPFVYTLSPPAAVGDPTDHFLFRSRAGFCEHYASAFTLLMRSAGIPARVVTGYLGGEYNALGDYLIVRQSDAHAWSEVWLEAQGWTRVDPTAAIAPERVLEGVLFQGEDPGTPVVYRNGERGRLQWLWDQVILSLDALNTQWHISVLGYDADRQRRLLKGLGLAVLDRFGATLGSAFGFLLATGVVYWLMLRTRSRRREPARILYDDFRRRMARVGLPPAPGEGPAHYTQRIRKARPDLGAQVDTIDGLYLRLRYSGRGTRRDLSELRRRVRRFRPRRLAG
jgi:transglutaminase-like putative cysteine protease